MNNSWHNPARQSSSFEAITVSNTAVGLTKANYETGVTAELTVENGPIRFRTDGTAATASVGHLLSDGDVLYIDNPSEMAALSMFRDGGTSGNISVSYFTNR